MIVDKNSWHMKVARSTPLIDEWYEPKNLCKHFWITMGSLAIWTILASLVMAVVSLVVIAIIAILNNPFSLVIIAAWIGGVALFLGLYAFLMWHDKTIVKVLKNIFLPIGKGLQFIFTPILRFLIFILTPGVKILGFMLRPLGMFGAWVITRMDRPTQVKIKKEKAPSFFVSSFKAFKGRYCPMIEVRE